jgi:hypothetical protein
LGLEYELLVSCFEFGESRKNKKIFLALSIAVLDQQLLKKIRHNTVMEPSTVYGISKQAGEDGVNTTIISLG